MDLATHWNQGDNFYTLNWLTKTLERKIIDTGQMNTTATFRKEVELNQRSFMVSLKISSGFRVLNCSIEMFKLLGSLGRTN